MISGGLAVLGLATSNPLETALAALLPAVFLQLLWRPGEPQILFFAVLMQSFQVAAPVFAADRQGITLAELEGVATMQSAFLFSTAAMVVLACGMAWASKKPASAQVTRNLQLIRQLNPERMLWAFIPAFVLSIVVGRFAFSLGGLAQFMLAFGGFHLILAYLIFAVAVIDKRFRPQAAFVLALEVLYGFLGFFSGFKTILFLLLIVLTAQYSNPLKVIRFKFILPAVILFLLLTFWQVVKTDYREFVNRGSSAQVVSVSVIDQLDFYASSIASFGPEQIVTGFDSGLARIGYLRFFATSMTRIPWSIPHQNGRLWSESLQVILQPRILYPDKPPINDSERTNEFSGVTVAGAAQGTSVSIGYVGESFIDFGFPLLLVPVALMGLLWGWMYRFLFHLPPATPLSAGFACIAILITAISFEQSNLKLLPGTAITFLVYWLYLRSYGISSWKWLTGR